MGKLKATEFGNHVAVRKSLFPGWSISLLKLRGARVQDKKVMKGWKALFICLIQCLGL